MNYNNNHQYNFEKKEDPFSFLKGDDHDFNSSLKGLEDMYENMMEPGVNQKKKDEEYKQKKQQLNEIYYHQSQHPNTVVGVPVLENNGQNVVYANQPYQQQQYYNQYQQYPQHPSPFDQQLQAKPYLQNSNNNNQLNYSQPIHNTQVPLNSAQLQTPPNYYPQQQYPPQQYPNQQINYHYQHH